MKFLLLFTFHYLYFTSVLSAGPNYPWSVIKKSIAVQEGKTISAWDEEGRSNVTASSRAVTMLPAGDGTYYYDFDLLSGAEYNFTLFAYSTFNITGLAAGATYYDTVPAGGSDGIYTSLFPDYIAGQQTAKYISINSQARRSFTVPYLAAGSTFYVFCNFAGPPEVINVASEPKDSQNISITWEVSGKWGPGGEAYKAADVLAGGLFLVFRSTVSEAGPYTQIASTPGYSSGYLDPGLLSNLTYYYVIVSSDAYTGAYRDTDIQNCISAERPGEFTAAQDRFHLVLSVPVYFKVEGIDWDYLEKHGFVVRLTPVSEDARFYPDRLKGVITRCYLE